MVAGEAAFRGGVKEDDTLSDDAEAAIDAALAQIAATGTAASSRAGSGDADLAGYDGADDEGAEYQGDRPRRKCRKGERGPRPGDGAGYPTDEQAPAPAV